MKTLPGRAYCVLWTTNQIKQLYNHVDRKLLHYHQSLAVELIFRVRQCRRSESGVVFLFSPRRKHLHSAAKAFSKLFKCFYISCKFYRISEILIPVLFHSCYKCLRLASFDCIKESTKLFKHRDLRKSTSCLERKSHQLVGNNCFKNLLY